MFEEPSSLPMRAAAASFLGGLFGVAMILYTHVVQAQEATPAAALERPAAVAILERLGDATLNTLRGTDAPANAASGMRGLRLRASAHSGAEDGGLRWQAVSHRVLRSEVDNPRSTDQVSVGLQLRF